MSALDKLEPLRTLPSVWISIIATSRTPEGSLAWSLTCKYDAGGSTHNVQYVSTSLDEVVTNLEIHLFHQGLDAPVVESPPPQRKLKLKRSTP